MKWFKKITYESLHIDEDWYLNQSVTIEEDWEMYLENRRYWLPVWIDFEWLKRID